MWEERRRAGPKPEPKVNLPEFLTSVLPLLLLWVQNSRCPLRPSHSFPEIVLGSIGNGDSCIHKWIEMTLKSNSRIHLETKGIKVSRMNVHVEKYSGDYLKRITVVTQKNRGIKCWRNKALRISCYCSFWLLRHMTEFFSFWHSWFPLTAWRIRGCIYLLDWDEKTEQEEMCEWDSARAGNLTEK